MACGGLLVFGPILATYRAAAAAGLTDRRAGAGRLVSGPPVGIGILSAGIILAIMIIPVHRLGDARRVRGDAADAQGVRLRLGCTTWEVVTKVVLPYTKTGVIGGIMLGLGARLGETMAVTFVIGNMNQLDSLSLFQAANSITSALANEFAEAGEGLHQASLMYLGLVLFFITFVVLSLSKLLLARLKKSGVHEHEDDSTPRQRHDAKRKRTNHRADPVAGGAMAFGVFWLIWILVETLLGWASAAWRLATCSPR